LEIGYKKMNINEKFERQVKKKVIGILETMIKKIKSGEISVVSYGFWPTLDKKIMFKFDALSSNFEKNYGDFRKYL
jgi:hypothetical protein